MQGDFERIVAWAAENPDTPLTAFTGHTLTARPATPSGEPTAEERALLLGEWNDTAHPSPEASLPELFAAQARRTPDAVAVVAGGTELTYARLERLAGAARAPPRRLRRRAGGPGRPADGALGRVRRRRAGRGPRRRGVPAARRAGAARPPAARRRRGRLHDPADRPRLRGRRGRDRLRAPARGRPRRAGVGRGRASRPRPPSCRTTSRTSCTPPGRPGVPKGVSIRHRDVAARALDRRRRRRVRAGAAALAAGVRRLDVRAVGAAAERRHASSSRRRESWTPRTLADDDHHRARDRPLADRRAVRPGRRSSRPSASPACARCGSAARSCRPRVVRPGDAAPARTSPS